MSFRELLKEIRYDLISDKKLNLKFIIHSYIFNSSFRLLLNYRIGKYLTSKDSKFCRILAMRYKATQLKKRNCQISYKAEIGRGVRFAHPLGIIIGEGVIIKDYVKIWQQVTLGSHGKKGKTPSYPVVENNVKIFAGAKLFGKIIIEENAVIGANAVVLEDVPENCIAVGIPAKIISPKI